MSMFRSIFASLGFTKADPSQADSAKDSQDEVRSVDGSVFAEFLEKDSMLNSSFGSEKESRAFTAAMPNLTIKQQIRNELKSLEIETVSISS